MKLVPSGSIATPDSIYFYHADVGNKVPLQVGSTADMLQTNQGVRCWRAGTGNRGHENKCDDKLISTSGVRNYRTGGLFHTIHATVPPIPRAVAPVLARADVPRAVDPILARAATHIPDTESHITPGHQVRHWDLPNNTDPHVSPGKQTRRWGPPNQVHPHQASSALHMSITASCHDHVDASLGIVLQHVEEPEDISKSRVPILYGNQADEESTRVSAISPIQETSDSRILMLYTTNPKHEGIR